AHIALLTSHIALLTSDLATLQSTLQSQLLALESKDHINLMNRFVICKQDKKILRLEARKGGVYRHWVERVHRGERERETGVEGMREMRGMV
ncbi:hypothetical protein HDU93_005918, partial [Gonapodya sp. JEL0774]